MRDAIERYVALITQLIIWLPLRTLFFVFGRLEVRGWGMIQYISSPTFLVITNHASFFDPFLVSHLFPFSTRFFPFRYPTFPSHYYTWKEPFMWILGSYPIFKDQPLKTSLEKSSRLLHANNRLLVFPEGKIKRHGRNRNARRGIAYLAAKTGVPILPCLIEGFDPLNHHIGFSWKKFLSRQYHLKVSFGRPFFIQDVYGKIPQTMEEYRQAAQKAMDEVYALKH